MTLLETSDAPTLCPHPDHPELILGEPGGWCSDCRGWWRYADRQRGRTALLFVVVRATYRPRRPSGPPHREAVAVRAAIDFPHLQDPHAIERTTTEVHAEFTRRTGARTP